MFICSWMINLGSINSRTNIIAFKWALVVGSLAFIIHSLPCLTERCSVCLRVNRILIEINLVWLHYQSAHWILADLESTEYFIRVVPLVTWGMIPPGGRLCLGGACSTCWGTWVGPVSAHWGVQSWGMSALVHTRGTWCTGLQALASHLGMGFKPGKYLLVAESLDCSKSWVNKGHQGAGKKMIT